LRTNHQESVTVSDDLAFVGKYLLDGAAAGGGGFAFTEPLQTAVMVKKLPDAAVSQRHRQGRHGHGAELYDTLL
jgi:hypothetical protein